MGNSLVAFLGPVGWPELVILAACCGMPVLMAAGILLVLYLTGTIGTRNKP